MKWNLRLAAAKRDIWKSSDMRQRLAERGLAISVGKMSYLWSGKPASIRLDDLEVICAVLNCGPEELLIAEPDTVQRVEAVVEEPKVVGGSGNAAVRPRRRDGRSLPPP
jgi:DNA-binding Xre family transcriptional regulator